MNEQLLGSVLRAPVGRLLLVLQLAHLQLRAAVWTVRHTVALKRRGDLSCNFPPGMQVFSQITLSRDRS